jgi:hypothetical protein
VVDRIEIETPGGRWWTVSRDLLVLRVTSCPSCRAPSPNEKASVEGHHGGRDGVQSEGKDSTSIARPASRTNDAPPTDIFHSEVQHG